MGRERISGGEEMIDRPAKAGIRFIFTTIKFRTPDRVGGKLRRGEGPGSEMSPLLWNAKPHEPGELNLRAFPRFAS